MKLLNHLKLVNLITIITGMTVVPLCHVRAASAAEIDRKANEALQKVYAQSAAARKVGHDAKAVLVFPDIVKAGFVLGGQRGEGALISSGHVIGYYRTTGASYGLQAGVQKFGYAMFFMSDGDLDYLRKSQGWEIGTGPSVVIVNQGMAKSLTTTTLRKGVYAIAFGQKGLMAGLGLQGTKIVPIRPD